MNWTLSVDLWHVLSVVGVGLVTRLIVSKIGQAIETGHHVLDALNRIDQGVKDLRSDGCAHFEAQRAQGD